MGYTFDPRLFQANVQKLEQKQLLFYSIKLEVSDDLFAERDQTLTRKKLQLVVSLR